MALPPLAPTLPASNTGTIEDTITLNGNEYIYELILSNGDISIRLPNRLIHELTIIDSIYSVFHYGHLVLKNDFSALENFTTSDGTMDSTIRQTSYLFRSNMAGDLITVKIKPKMPPFNANSLDDATWSLSFQFSIYDEDEIHDPEGNGKLKIFRFCDIREDLLSNTHIPWSTTDLIVRKNQTSFNISQSSNDSRAAKTGDAIKDIITTSLPDFEIKFDKDWDQGATTIFYSTPYDQCRFDALEYMLDYHQGFNTSDVCLLKFERDGTWSLLPLETYFKRALNKGVKQPGDFTIDIFHMHSEQNVENQTEFKIPAQSKVAYDVRIPLEEFTGLFNYSFSNITNRDSCKEIVTTPVHYVSPMQKQFGVDFKNNTIDDIADAFQKMYVDKMHGESPTHTIPINIAKEKQYIFNPVFSLNTTRARRSNNGRNRVIKKILGLSHALTFNLEGFTIRRSGRFISVVNTGSFPENAFQNTIQGEWFITQVAHTFVGNTYRNEIVCTKPYTYKNLY